MPVLFHQRSDKTFSVLLESPNINKTSSTSLSRFTCVSFILDNHRLKKSPLSLIYVTGTDNSSHPTTTHTYQLNILLFPFISQDNISIYLYPLQPPLLSQLSPFIFILGPCSHSTVQFNFVLCPSFVHRHSILYCVSSN